MDLSISLTENNKLLDELTTKSNYKGLKYICLYIKKNTG